MEIRAFAEQVLFAEDLAEKLASPGVIDDARPGGVGTLPAVPGRPPGLRFAEQHARVPMPRPRELGSPDARGVLLHAFANHELLAMELMALFLLARPDAPPAFRRGLAHILVEEQLHLRLYLERLAAHGLEFGALPVNRFLWDCVAETREIADFTARMGLTFEAANLDHALDWGRALRAAGDEQSAAVLDRVYQDELGHVKHALHWFRRETAGEPDLWESWTARLHLPLNPERARGRELCVEARREAGFDEGFIEALAIYACSKGRPPTVRLFNPDAEAQVASADPAFVAEGPAEALARDLDLLPAALAARDDVVVVRRPPRPAFLRQLVAGGLTLPQIVVVPELARLGESELRGRKIAGVDPWGWSPAAARWVGPLAASARTPPAGWSWPRRALYTKGLASALLREFLAAHARDGGLCPPEAAGELAWSAAEVESALAALLDGGRATALLKAPFGTAGRGARRVQGPLAEADRAWLERALADGAPVVVQPWLDRVLDLSFHADVEPEGGVRWRGITRFFTTEGGRYLGTWVGPLLGPLPPGLARFLHADGREQRWLERVGRAVTALVGREAAALGHQGPFGVDAFVYEWNGELKLQPLVEINPRTTMGRVGLALHDRVRHGRAGLFAVLSRGDLRQAGYKSFSAWAAARPPLVVEQGRIAGGVWFPTDPEPATAFASALAVGDELTDCRAALGLGS